MYSAGDVNRPTAAKNRRAAHCSSDSPSRRDSSNGTVPPSSSHSRAGFEAASLQRYGTVRRRRSSGVISPSARRNVSSSVNASSRSAFHPSRPRDVHAVDDVVELVAGELAPQTRADRSEHVPRIPPLRTFVVGHESTVSNQTLGCNMDSIEFARSIIQVSCDYLDGGVSCRTTSSRARSWPSCSTCRSTPCTTGAAGAPARPASRIGKRVVYKRQGVDEWLDRQAADDEMNQTGGGSSVMEIVATSRAVHRGLLPALRPPHRPGRADLQDRHRRPWPPDRRQERQGRVVVLALRRRPAAAADRSRSDPSRRRRRTSPSDASPRRARHARDTSYATIRSGGRCDRLRRGRHGDHPAVVADRHRPLRLPARRRRAQRRQAPVDRQRREGRHRRRPPRWPPGGPAGRGRTSGWR